MKVENSLYPNHDQMKGFFDNEDDGKTSSALGSLGLKPKPAV